MRTQINSYLTFNGNCKEAMTFYKECLGGKLVLQTVGDSPLSEKMPKQMKNSILHATLTKHSLVLMGTDMAPSKGLIKGNTISLSIQCNSLEQIETYFEKLSQGGKVEHPLEHNFWGTLVGNLTDKFGNQWLLSYNKNTF
ncbi:VOC family protein [Mariniflexile gromovii]|uniref:VOC family protein n=1 Tax=Mariniflexile gromovii TaxID=362523 RepID=A0ABS4BT23_9FLAO|nr:VOC family protein [Mariniflexile gromovii]MBP0903738.1 VOC family protein [Mariniflexile gromovii]